MLQNLSFEQYCIKKFWKIQEGIGLSEYEKLNHHQALGFDLFCMLIRFPWLIGTRLMLNYSSNIWTVKTEETLKDINLMAIRLDQKRAVRARLKQCKSVQEVKNLHDRLVTVLNQRTIDELPNNNFPTPPIMGTEMIIPVTGSQDLAGEGQGQHHCVRGYGQMIGDGRYYVCQVLMPERATLGLAFHKISPPTINQLLLNCNKPISKETRNHVDKWLLKSIVLRDKSA